MNYWQNIQHIKTKYLLVLIFNFFKLEKVVVCILRTLRNIKNTKNCVYLQIMYLKLLYPGG